MLFVTPSIDEREARVIVQVDQLRNQLSYRLHEPRRWSGSLRRLSLARAVQGSNSIEGYNASLDDVAAAADGNEPFDASGETLQALRGYQQAMTYVLQLANDPAFVYSEQLLKSLQFMMTSYDLGKRPGQWRAGSIFVRNDATGDVVYEGPDVELVSPLMEQLVLRLNTTTTEAPIVSAAMAHLNLVMIHPFRDGNGRMARCLQTLVLTREVTLSPIFCSVEEYLGRNTQNYYHVLGEVGGGAWLPERDARPWLRFMLTAHLRQARTMLIRARESEELWDVLERYVTKAGLPERNVSALFDAAIGLRVRNSSYRSLLGNEISDQVASRDLKSLVDAGLLQAHGEKRGRFYSAADSVRAARVEVRARRSPTDNGDPFVDAA